MAAVRLDNRRGRNNDGNESTTGGSSADLSSSGDYDSGTESSTDGSDTTELPIVEKQPMSQGQAAARIQGLYRRKKAREHFLCLVRQGYERVYDEETDTYFYYNKISRVSQWTAPQTLRGEILNPREEWAAKKIQNIFRKKRAWMKTLTLLNEVYEKEYDPETDNWFYVNKVTMETTWDKPVLFGDKEPPVNRSDSAVMEKDEEIKELKKLLEEREKEAEQAKRSLEDKINEAKIKSGEADVDEVKGRSKHMDEWGIEHVVEWLHEVGYPEYDGQVRENKVDGLLLLHLMNEDWVHLGVRSALHVRRIEVAMQKYRLRFEHKQAGGDGDESDNFSDVSGSDTPSELLDEDDMYGDDNDIDSDQENAYRGDDQRYLPPGNDELIELERDRQNVIKEIIFEGDAAEGGPSPGNVVKIHYTCTLEDGTTVESSRKTRRRAFEFVLGAGQVIKGLDRTVGSMVFGERARITVSPEYAYGDKGWPPVVPSNATLVFDVNLMQFWPRPRWNKPLIQVISAPYTETPYARRTKVKGDSSAEEGKVAVAGEGDTRLNAPYGKYFEDGKCLNAYRLMKEGHEHGYYYRPHVGWEMKPCFTHCVDAYRLMKEGY